MTNNPAYMQELLAATGGIRGVPVIVIDSEVVHGFNKDRIARLLGIQS